MVGHTAAGKKITFQHPAFQSAFMFLGETLCLIPFALITWRKVRARLLPLAQYHWSMYLSVPSE